MSDALKAQQEGRFEDMEGRDKEIQASIHERGALLPEDEEMINQLSSDEERMRRAYEHIERAFREKFGRVMDAMEHPAEVQAAVENMGVGIDLNDPNVPMVSGTNPEGR
jgi:hypothetical protein